MKDEATNNYFTESRIALEQYVKDRILLLKLQASEKIARLVALLFTVFLLALLGFFVVLFLSMMAGFYLAAVTGSFFAGFGIIAGFYLVLFLVLYFNRQSFSRMIIDKAIMIFFDKTTHTDENQS
jgi:uncharacterized membrane protein YdjX (TVP38/TMEM64 family)